MRDDAVLGRALPLDRGLGRTRAELYNTLYRWSNTNRFARGRHDL